MAYIDLLERYLQEKRYNVLQQALRILLPDKIIKVYTRQDQAKYVCIEVEDEIKEKPIDGSYSIKYNEDAIDSVS